MHLKDSRCQHLLLEKEKKHQQQWTTQKNEPRNEEEREEKLWITEIGFLRRKSHREERVLRLDLIQNTLDERDLDQEGKEGFAMY